MLDVINSINKRYRQSFYIYNEEVMIEQAKRLHESLRGFDFLYSVKANPFAPVLRAAAALGFGADAASAKEVELALAAGHKTTDIYYSTAGKTRADLEKAIGKCTIIADSFNELALLNELAAERGTALEAGLRINPDFTMTSDQGQPNKYGVDQEQLPQRADWLKDLKHIKIAGFHVHLRSQVLDAGTLAAYYEKIMNMTDEFSGLFGGPDFINFGGGLGIPDGSAQNLDIAALGGRLDILAEKFRKRPGRVRLMIETGRYLAGQAGSYITEIVDIKISRGKKYLIVRHGLNGFLRPVMAEFVKKTAKPHRGIAPPQFGGGLNASAGNGLDSPLTFVKALTMSLEPLFTSPASFEFSLIGAGGEAEEVTVVGSLCAGTDNLAENIMLPKAEIGDLIKISNAGCYAYSLSPILFSSHPAPLQFLLASDGRLVEV